MSYKLKPTESFAKGFERIAGEQIERAVASLGPDMDVHKGAHEGRKAMKRLRSLLALYRGVLRERDYRSLNQRCRQIGLTLAGTREVQALLDSLGQLEERFGKDSHNSALAALRRQLQERYAAARSGAAGHNDSRVALVEEVKAIGARVARVEVGQAGFGAIRPGLVEVYRAARDLLDDAYEIDTGEAFHEWRKALQRHWRHLQLLNAAWPHELRGRAQLVRTIAETIGQDHDLTMLSAYMAQHQRQLGTAAQVRSAQALCRERQEELRAGVRGAAELLFAERPQAFADRLERYWALGIQPALDTKKSATSGT